MGTRKVAGAEGKGQITSCTVSHLETSWGAAAPTAPTALTACPQDNGGCWASAAPLYPGCPPPSDNSSYVHPSHREPKIWACIVVCSWYLFCMVTTTVVLVEANTWELLDFFHEKGSRTAISDSSSLTTFTSRNRPIMKLEKQSRRSSLQRPEFLEKQDTV